MEILLIIVLFLVGASFLFVQIARYVRERSLSEATRKYGEIASQTGLDSLSDIQQQSDLKRRGGIVAWLTGRVERSSFLRSDESGNFVAWLDHELVLAGRPRGLHAPEAIAYTVLIWFVGSIFLVFAAQFLEMPRLLAAAAALALFIYPIVRLRTIKKKRQANARLELPTFLNDLILSLSTGMSTIDDAFERVSRMAPYQPHRVLVQEFSRAFAEYRHGGRDREQALYAAAARIGVPSVDDFVDAIIQGLRNGTPVRDILRSQSKQVQSLYRQEMREYIGKKEPLFVVSLVMIFSGVMLLMIIPLAIQVIDGIGG